MAIVTLIAHRVKVVINQGGWDEKKCKASCSCGWDGPMMYWAQMARLSGEAHLNSQKLPSFKVS